MLRAGEAIRTCSMCDRCVPSWLGKGEYVLSSYTIQKKKRFTGEFKMFSLRDWNKIKLFFLRTMAPQTLNKLSSRITDLIDLLCIANGFVFTVYLISPENYTAVPVCSASLVILLFSAAVKQHRQVSSVPLDCGWTVKERQLPDDILSLPVLSEYCSVQVKFSKVPRETNIFRSVHLLHLLKCSPIPPADLSISMEHSIDVKFGGRNQ